MDPLSRFVINKKKILSKLGQNEFDESVMFRTLH